MGRRRGRLFGFRLPTTLPPSRQTRRLMRSPRRAFTLVELLVLIGIIAALVALLMPALSGAREAAQQTKCLATLRSMAQAAQMHAAEHRGYMPVAGAQSPAALGVAPTPQGLL